MIMKINNQLPKKRKKYLNTKKFLKCLFCFPLAKVRFMVQANDKSKRASKQQAADLVDKEQDDDVRRSIKRSNLVRQKEFKKMKKNQKRTGEHIDFFKFIQLKIAFFSLEKTVASLGDALDSMVRLTTTSSNKSNNDSYNFETDFV